MLCFEKKEADWDAVFIFKVFELAEYPQCTDVRVFLNTKSKLIAYGILIGTDFVLLTLTKLLYPTLNVSNRFKFICNLTGKKCSLSVIVYFDKL